VLAAGVTHASQEAAPAEAASPEPPGVPTVAVERGERFERLTIEFPQGLVASALQSVGGGRRSLLFLARPIRPKAPQPVEDGKNSSAATSQTRKRPPCTNRSAPLPLTLWRVRNAAAREVEVERVRGDLPGEISGLRALDLDGDGSDELLLDRPGRVDLLRSPEAPLELLVEDAALTAGLLRPPPGAGPSATLYAAVVGGVRSYGADAGGSFRLLSESTLPVIASRTGAGFRIESPTARLLDPGPDGRPRLAAAPIAADALRLRTVLLDPEAQAPEARQSESWARLPQRERVIETAFLRIDGQAVLALTSRPADKLSFFGEKLIRLFPLERDRSRAGIEPLLATESGMNLWQDARLVARDLDGDGHEDLIAAYWKGLKDDQVVLEAYLKLPDGSFDRKARTTAFDVDDANRSVLGFGDDLDGDGMSELVLAGAGRLLIHRGLAGRRGADLVEPKPHWIIPAEGLLSADLRDGGGEFDLEMSDDGAHLLPLQGASAARRAIDLDGDGRKELIWDVRSGESGDKFVRLRLD
jgi:hypothetical protein